jgi:membrane-associated protein
MENIFSVLQEVVSFILHVDRYLDLILVHAGGWFYGILILIVFCETGLVVMPFLPGDSLLFAAGALVARSDLSIHLLALGVFFAAVVGDFVNYHVGKYLGPRVLALNSRVVRPAHIIRTREFFVKYGPRAVVLARFVPIVRTFAPFLAGLGGMNYGRFFFYNVLGAGVWVSAFLYAGYFFGELEVIRQNFTLVALAIVGVSFLPLLVEALRVRGKFPC